MTDTRGLRKGLIAAGEALAEAVLRSANSAGGEVDTPTAAQSREYSLGLQGVCQALAVLPEGLPEEAPEEAPEAPAEAPTAPAPAPAEAPA